MGNFTLTFTWKRNHKTTPLTLKELFIASIYDSSLAPWPTMSLTLKIHAPHESVSCPLLAKLLDRNGVFPSASKFLTAEFYQHLTGFLYCLVFLFFPSVCRWNAPTFLMLGFFAVIFRVYCADHTYCTLRFPLSTNGETVKRSAADKLGLNLENMLLVELKSNGKGLGWLGCKERGSRLISVQEKWSSLIRVQGKGTW